LKLASDWTPIEETEQIAVLPIAPGMYCFDSQRPKSFATLTVRALSLQNYTVVEVSIFLIFSKVLYVAVTLSVLPTGVLARETPCTGLIN
jgi:hypothetical protein